MVQIRKTMTALFMVFMGLFSFATLASQTDSQLCLQQAGAQHDLKVTAIKEMMLKQMQSCYHYPLGDLFELCRYQAEVASEQELQKESVAYSFRKKECLSQ